MQGLELLNAAWLLAPFIGMMILVVGFYVGPWAWEERNVYPSERTLHRFAIDLAEFKRGLLARQQAQLDSQQATPEAGDAIRKRQATAPDARRGRSARSPVDRSSRSRRNAA